MTIEADGEAAEILRLTCLQQSIRADRKALKPMPTIRNDGTRFVVTFPIDKTRGVTFGFAQGEIASRG